MIIKLVSRQISTEIGNFTEHLFFDGKSEIITLTKGHLNNCKGVLCRVHSKCISAHYLLSSECDCLFQMRQSQKLISNESRGIIILLDQEGRGNGHYALMLATRSSMKNLINQSKTYEKSGFSSDSRSYRVVADILDYFFIKSIVLLSNNPDKKRQLIEYGIKVVEMKGIIQNPVDNQVLARYYKNKIEDGHIFPNVFTKNNSKTFSK